LSSAAFAFVSAVLVQATVAGSDAGGMQAAKVPLPLNAFEAHLS
jgi:hypothetical protein